MKLNLTAAFAANTSIEEKDVRPVKRVLNRLGYYTPPKDAGSTHIADKKLFDGLKQFQKDHGLIPSGSAKPGDKTEEALNAAMENQTGAYIWRTRQDDKVRSSHAANEGKIFSWNNPPDGKHPGEDYGCRCWAELVTFQSTHKCEKFEIDWINALGELKSAEDKLKKAITEKKAIEENIKDLEELLKKETSLIWGDKGKARNIGAALGLAGGSIVGGFVGGASGISAGSNLGALAEETLDFITGKKTDLQLRQEIKDKKDALKKLSDEIEKNLKPTVEKIKNLAKQKEQAFRLCQRSQKEKMQ